MDLQQTIADLEKQAAQFTEAANALRALLPQQPAGKASGSSTTGANTDSAAPRRRGRQPGSKNKATNKPGRGKKVVSPETRAKIAAAIKASHEKRRAARDGSA